MIQEPSAPLSISDHDLLRLIGKGSYGEVWLARNVMGSYRAVKVIRRSNFESASPFEREVAGLKRFEPLSRTHEGFVDVLQIGWSDQEACLYYIMEAADDVSLGQAINPDSYVPKTLGKALAQVKRFPVDQVVQMGMALCQALEHLHSHGLVHRDIKPSNIVFVNGRPKLADIGLVTESENARSFVGTEGFIPPEGPGAKQADIYGLGKALYEIASGRDRLDFPALPADLADFPDGEDFLELNEVLIRACKQSTAQRYANARDMYEDLALLVSGRSLRRLRALERRWQKTKRAVAITAGVVVGAGVVAFPIIQERQHSEEIRERQIGVRSANGINKMAAGDLPGALAEFSDIYILEKDKPDRLLANQVRIASILAQTPKINQMLFVDGRVTSVGFTPDQTHVLSVEKSQKFRVHELASGRPAGETIELGRIWQAAFSPNGQRAALADEGGRAIIVDWRTGKRIEVEQPGGALFASFNRDGKRLGTAGGDNTARIWDAETGEKLFELHGHTDFLRCIKFSPDEKLILTTSSDRTARLWDASTGAAIAVLRHPDWVMHGAFSPDSQQVVTGGHDNWAHLWNVKTGEEIPTLMKHDDVVMQVDFSPCGMTILTGSTDGTARLWDARTRMPLANYNVLRHSSGVLSVAFAENGRQFVTGCADGSIRVWDLVTTGVEPIAVAGTINNAGSKMAVLKAGAIEISDPAGGSETNRIEVTGDISELALSDSGSTLAALTSQKNALNISIQVWNNFSEATALNVSSLKASRLTLSSDGSLLAFREPDATRIFNVPEKVEWSLPEDFKDSGEFAFSPLTKSVALANGSAVQILDSNTRPIFPAPFKSSGNVRHLVFSPDERLLLVSQADATVTPRSAILIDTKTGQPVGPEVWHRDGIVQGAFSPDSLRVITAGEDREALLWESNLQRTIIYSLPHPHQVLSVAFSPDGRWIAATAGDRTVRIWDNETGQPLTPSLRGQENSSRVIFLKGGLQFATVHTATRFSLWTLPRLEIPADDILSLSHLLNSDLRVAGKKGSRKIAEVWNELRSKHSGPFVSTAPQIAIWHERQRLMAARSKQSTAVAFHQNRAAQFKP